MKIISEKYNANVVELSHEEYNSLKEKEKFQEFMKFRMPEIEEYMAKVINYIENNTSTHYADYYEANKYKGYEDTYRYIMNLEERIGGFDQLFDLTKKLLDEYGFEQITLSILLVVIRDEIEQYGIHHFR